MLSSGSSEYEQAKRLERWVPGSSLVGADSVDQALSDNVLGLEKGSQDRRLSRTGLSKSGRPRDTGSDRK